MKKLAVTFFIVVFFVVIFLASQEMIKLPFAVVALFVGLLGAKFIANPNLKQWGGECSFGKFKLNFVAVAKTTPKIILPLFIAFFIWRGFVPSLTMNKHVVEENNRMSNLLVIRQAVEMYHAEYGQYPERLENLAESDFLPGQLSPVDFDDTYVYERQGAGYLLYNSGFDGMGGTDDDIVLDEPDTKLIIDSMENNQ